MADLNDDQKRHAEIERADRAKALLENKDFASALADIENEVLVAMEATHDDQTILKLHRMFVIGRKFKNILSSRIDTGKMAAIQLESKRKLRLWGG